MLRKILIGWRELYLVKPGNRPNINKNIFPSQNVPQKQLFPSNQNFSSGFAPFKHAEKKKTILVILSFVEILNSVFLLYGSIAADIE